VGLSLARRLVELHGGTIEAHSGGPGRGSRFVVRLPLTGNVLRGNLSSDAPTQRTTAAALRILIADDNRDFADSLAVLLRGAGHAVSVTHDGASAMVKALELKPELAFLDIGLPGRNGYDLARTLRSLPATRGTMLVAITGWGQDKDKALARDAGFDRHLVKPVSPEAVSAIIDEVSARGAQGVPSASS
jgi:CheY-like chemotaxis protein